MSTFTRLTNGNVIFEDGSQKYSFTPRSYVYPHPLDENLIIISDSIGKIEKSNFTFNWNLVTTPLEGSRSDLIQELSENFFVLSGSGTSGVSLNHVFANAAARDVYFDSPDPHLNELLPGLEIILLDDGSGNAVMQFWGGTANPSTYVNTNWLQFGTLTAIQSALIASLISISDTRIPVKSGNIFVDSAFRETSDQIVSDKEIVTTPTSLVWGVNGARLSSAGEVLVFEGTDAENSFLIQNTFNSATGSLTFTRSRLIARDVYTIQSVKTTNSVLNPTFNYTISSVGNPAENIRHTDQLIIESADSGTVTATITEGGRMLRTVTKSILANVETPIDLEKPICLAVGSTVNVEITGDVRLKGTDPGSGFVPFLKVRSHLGYRDQIATADTMGDFASNIRDALHTLTGSNRLNRDSIFQETIEVAADITITSANQATYNTRKLVITAANIEVNIQTGVTLDFIDIWNRNNSNFRLVGLGGVRINEESDLSFREHEGARIVPTGVTDRYAMLFSSVDVDMTDNYVDVASLETGNILTLGRTGSLADLTVDLSSLAGVGAGSILTTVASYSTTGTQNIGVDLVEGVHILSSVTTGFDLLTNTTLTDNGFFVISKQGSSMAEFDISATAYSFVNTNLDPNAYNIAGGYSVLFYVNGTNIYPISDTTSGGSAAGDHPVTLIRDTPSVSELNALALASLNANSALWVVASDQILATENAIENSIQIRALESGLLDVNGDAIPTSTTQKNGGTGDAILLQGGSIVRIFSSTDLRVVSAPGVMARGEMYPDVPFSGSINIEEDQGLYNSYLRRTATNAGGVTNEYIRMPDLHPSFRPSWVVPGDVFVMRHTGTATGAQRPAFRIDNTGDTIAGHGSSYFANPGQTIAIQAPARGIRTWQLFPVSQRSDGGTYYDPEVAVEISDWYRDDEDATAVNNSVRLHHRQEIVEGNVRDHVITQSSSNNPVSIGFEHRNIQDDIAWINWFTTLGFAVPPLGTEVEEIKINVETALSWIQGNVADNSQFQINDPTLLDSIQYITHQTGETLKIGLSVALASHFVLNDVINISGNSFAGNNGDWAITQIYGDRLAIDITIPGSTSANNTGASGIISRILYATNALVSDDLRVHNFNLYRNSARNNPVTSFTTDWFDIVTDPVPTGCILNIGYNTDIETTGSQIAVQDDAGNFFAVKGSSRDTTILVDNRTTPVTTGTALPINIKSIFIDSSVENIFYLPEFPNHLDVGEARYYDISSTPNTTIGNAKVVVGSDEVGSMVTLDEGFKDLTALPHDSLGIKLYNNGVTSGAKLYKHIHRRIQSNIVYPTQTNLPSISFLLPFTQANISSTKNEDPHGHIFDLSTNNRVVVKAKGRYTFHTSIRMYFTGSEPSGLLFASPVLTPYTTGNDALYEYSFSVPLFLARNGAAANNPYITLQANFDFDADVDDWFEFEIQTLIPPGYTIADFKIQNFTFSITADIGG